LGGEKKGEKGGPPKETSKERKMKVETLKILKIFKFWGNF